MHLAQLSSSQRIRQGIWLRAADEGKISAGTALALADGCYERCPRNLGDPRVLGSIDRLRDRMRQAVSPWELVFGSTIAVVLTAYLVYALLRPERF